MAHISVIGLFVYCRRCSHKFRLGPLNAREVNGARKGQPEPYATGWICKCDRCEAEQEYARADLLDA